MCSQIYLLHYFQKMLYYFICILGAFVVGYPKRLSYIRGRIFSLNMSIAASVIQIDLLDCVSVFHLKGPSKTNSYRNIHYLKFLQTFQWIAAEDPEIHLVVIPG